MTSSSCTLEGIGLRSGLPARVILHRRPGPFALHASGVDTPRALLHAEDADRATLVRAGASTVATVEHLLAACAALGLHEGLLVEVVGGEVPLLDGCARAFAAALATLDLAPREPPLVVTREETIAHGESRYTFRPAKGPARTGTVAVTLAFDDPRIAPDAAWDGSAGDFLGRIAGARTFAFAHEVLPLIAAGHASHVDRASAVVFTPDAVLASGAPVAPDEPARHKLLDLLGDLFLYGGPPRGHVHALRPGHRATHAILHEALARGVVA